MCHLSCQLAITWIKINAFLGSYPWVIFPNLCYQRLSSCSNLGGVDPEKTLSSHLKFAFCYSKETFVVIDSCFCVFFFHQELSPALIF